jgi:ABC-type Fe3+/spermidine/putrescine transport system ATPase subunit
VKLLLFDEPLSNLDAELRVQMRIELRDLQRRLSATSIYVTHDQEEAMALSDRIAVMRAGRIVELGAPDQLYLRPRHPFTARFIGQAELVAAELIARDGAGALLRTPLGDIACAEAASAPDTGAASLLVRPEHIEMLPAGATGPNTIPARVAAVSFLGKLADHEVEAAGLRLRVQTMSTDRRPPGAEVTLRLPPARCVALPPEAAPAA